MTPFSLRPAFVVTCRCWVFQVMPVYQSQVLTCVLTRGGRVSLCRHVRVPPIFWLCFNTCTWITLLWNLTSLKTFLYTFVHYLLYKRDNERRFKKKMFITWCWLLCKYNIFTIKVLYCYDPKCPLFFVCFFIFSIWSHLHFGSSASGTSVQSSVRAYSMILFADDFAMFYLWINNMVTTLDCFYVFILPVALRERKSFKAKTHK